jgi:hypothetical protein
MLGVLITLTFCKAVGIYVLTLFQKPRNIDPALRVGLAGLIGLGAMGTLTLFLGLIPGFINHAATPFLLYWIVTAALLYAYPKTRKMILPSLKLSPPQGGEWAIVAAVVACLVIALIGTLAPPTMVEWDSLAYHLAVPKLWLAAGHIYYIPYIHHSNFPFVFDGLYIWGLQWGGEPGAKAFVLYAAYCGGFAIFGLTRTLYGRAAAWWAVLAYATVPVILWLSGTAYIDVPNGLCAGLGIALAAFWIKNQDKNYLWLATMMLGLATASKYTGLQTIGAVGVLILATGFRRHQPIPYFKSAVLMGLVAIAIACPWYAKNWRNTGNPVYPFFYSILKGKNWSPDQAAVYTHEQLTFGVGVNADTGHHDIKQLGHAVLGLAYQPGRYINADQEHGGGTPLGAIGVTVLGAILAWALSGKSRAFELANLAAIGISLFLWFYLSQQSRYIVTLAIPAAILYGGGVVRLRAKSVLAVAGSLQAAYSLFLVGFVMAGSQWPVVSGAQSRDDYLTHAIGFYEPSKYINQSLPKTAKVALYDEVFGYLLDVPYYWANPGHSNEIPYAQMQTGQDYARAMRQMGFTHVYLNLSLASEQDAQTWLAASGLQGPPKPWPSQDRAQKMSEFQYRFLPLTAEAVARGDLKPIQSFRGGGILFEFTK